MPKMLSVIDIIEENEKVYKENEVLQQELEHLITFGASLKV